MVRNFVTQITDEGKSIARSIREHIVGSEVTLEGKNAAERALIALAVDVYPPCLLSPDPALPPASYDLGPNLMAMVSNTHKRRSSPKL
jgi:hypothetical protein